MKIEEYNPNKRRKILIVSYYMISSMLSNKKLNPMLTELFIRGGKLNTSRFLLRNFILLYQKNVGLKFYTLFYCENSK